MSSFGKKMGLLQLGLFSMGAALLVLALAVKAERPGDAPAPGLVATSPAAGDVMTDLGAGSSPAYAGDDAGDDDGHAIAPMIGSEDQLAPIMGEAPCDFTAWVGRKVDEDAVKATGRPYRLLKPDTPVTMDFNPERINVESDDNDIVTRVTCG